MQSAGTGGKWLLLLAGLWLVQPAAARTLRAEIAALDAGLARAEGLRLELRWPDGATQGELVVTVDRLDADDFGYRFAALDWRCPLARDGEGNWRCEGTLRSAGHPDKRLAVAVSAVATEVDLMQGRSRVGLRRHVAAPDDTRLLLERVPVAWLQSFLATLWTEGRPQAGRVDGRLSIRAPADAPLQVAGDLRLAGTGLDTPDGWLAAEGVAANVRLDYRRDERHQRLSLRGEFRGGELLAGTLYVPLPATALPFELAGEQRGAGGWRFPRLRWDDGRTLALEGSLALDADFGLTALELTARSDDLAALRERYLTGWLGLIGLADLQLHGAVEAAFALDADGPRTLRLRPRAVNIVDPAGRFGVAGLAGDLHWTAAAQPQRGELHWAGGAVYGIGLGAARFPLESSARELRLASPVVLDVLAGTLRLDDFRLTPPLGTAGARAQLGIDLQGLDLAQLSQRLGWPPFTGSLGGRIPAARYADNRLVFEGGLSMNLFDGEVRIGALSMERPFGVAPTLSADVDFSGLDLEPLTAAFGFGEITGRLQGRIAGLRLLDWSPVAFDADLHTDPDWRGRRRISQRAVQDISNIGGGGLAAGLQNQLLRRFSSFGYSRIGIRCRLADDVCRMDGIGSAGQGYTIVEGAGLPRITVVGFQRRVDWPVLVDRLKAATEGQTPIVR